ncbi:hypothetical protein [Flavobacterium piscis]|nr:hypothetical protein [Flavobacterium piscis]
MDIEIPGPELKWFAIALDKKEKGDKKVTCSAFGKPENGFLFLKIK